jgi:16S rRNA processing protein RimM
LGELPDWVALALLHRARGIRGEINAENLGSDPDRFVAGLKATLLDSVHDRNGRLVEVEKAWFHVGSLVLKFVGIDDRTEAETLRGKYLCVREEERPPAPEGQVYLSDLIGCEVVSIADGRHIGVVSGWQDIGPHALLELGDDLLIPYVPAICRKVDLEAKRIEAELPEGLEDLNRK